MAWQPVIPGTDVDRIEFLLNLIRISSDPLTHTKLFRASKIKEVASWGVLSARQIAQVTGCSRRVVKEVLKVSGLPPVTTRGVLTQESLTTMLAVAQQYAQGYKPGTQMIEMLALAVSSTLLERLVGTPKGQAQRVKRRYEQRQQ